jgi:hypothetical protein
MDSEFELTNWIWSHSVTTDGTEDDEHSETEYRCGAESEDRWAEIERLHARCRPVLPVLERRRGCMG